MATRLSDALWLRYQNEDGIADEALADDFDTEDAELSRPRPDVAAYDEAGGAAVEAEPDDRMAAEDDEIADPDPDGGDPDDGDTDEGDRDGGDPPLQV
ncbi:hypothetical protein [Fodinicurvata sp. EGI_FJ10296]|uniref:hypothetical protein n=1 Tax=Fodinicurvata sp. EGI_FJ10296 TaxID=3231908 RepID=UPI0034547ED9